MKDLAQTGTISDKPGRNRSLAPLLISLALIFFTVTESFAGPPLLTDDPGILDPGSWEVIAAISGEQRSGGELAHSPTLDISSGLTDNTQFSLSLPYGVIEPKITQTEPDVEVTTFSYKWRILSETNWELAVGANYELPISQNNMRDQGEPRSLGLPLMASYSRGDWEWHGLAGWCIESDGTRSFEYGLAMGHPLTRSTRWMAEIMGSASGLFRENTLLFNLGLDYEFSPVVHVLVSAGSRLNVGPEPATKLEMAFYVGLQWFK